MAAAAADAFPKPQLTAVDDESINWETTLMLVSHPTDAKGFLVPKASKRHSAFLNDLLAEGAPGADEEKVIVPINGLAKQSVQAVAWFMTAFADEGKEPRALDLPRPFPHAEIAPHVSPFEAKFAEELFPKVGTKDMKGLVGILHAANFLQVKGLLILASVGLTFHFRGKTPTEIKDLMENQEPLYESA